MRTENTQIAISTLCESAFNVPKTNASDYEGLPTTEPFFLLPKVEKINDGNRVGRNAPSHLCNTYWSHSEVAIKDDVDTNVPARLLRRALGGGLVADTLFSTGVWDHTFNIMPPQVGDTLPSFNIVAILGAADFLLSGVMVDSIKFSQKNAERVQYEANLVGSGKFAASGFSTFPGMATTPCMDGYKVEVKYTDVDGVTPVNLSNMGKVVEWMVEHKNNIRRDKRRTGDPIQTVSGGSAAHTRKQPRGKYETTAQITVDFNDLADWTKSVKNEQLTNLSFLIPGPAIGTSRHEFELIIPLFSFDTPETGDDDGDATTPINIVCLEDPVTKGTIKARIRNATPTLI